VVPYVVVGCAVNLALHLCLGTLHTAFVLGLELFSLKPISVNTRQC